MRRVGGVRGGNVRVRDENWMNTQRVGRDGHKNLEKDNSSFCFLLKKGCTRWGAVVMVCLKRQRVAPPGAQRFMHNEIIASPS